MFTPYDWQEGIGNRAGYIEGKLAQGAPVLAVSLDEGILVFTYRRTARKIFEIYDRLIFGAIGQQSDIEALRTAALEFAHSEGYNRSEDDVTVQRVVTAISVPIKKAFNDFSTAPFVVRSLFAEVNDTPENDLFYTLEYDGDYAVGKGLAVVAGNPEAAEKLRDSLQEIKSTLKAEKALDRMQEIWLEHIDPEGVSRADVLKGASPEAVLLERSAARENRFRALTQEAV
jgi:proteasome alpha subunit